MARDDDWPESGGEGVEPGDHYDDLNGAGLDDDDADRDQLTDLSAAAEDDSEQTAATDEPGTPPESALPPKVEAWRKRSATGAVLTGIAFGLQQVFGKEREEPAIIMTTSGDPPRDLPVEAEVEHGRPRRSVVNIRPWLLENQGGPGPEAGPAPAGGTHPADEGDDDPPSAGSPPGDG